MHYVLQIFILQAFFKFIFILRIICSLKLFNNSTAPHSIKTRTEVLYNGKRPARHVSDSIGTRCNFAQFGEVCQVL